MNRYAKLAPITLALLSWSSLAHAENADRDKPIHLEADFVLVDDMKQTSVFEGKVELIQGTLRIQAEKIVVTEDKQGHQRCIATGKLARFRQKHEGTNEYMEGYGENIEYDTRAETVDFFGQARVKRERDDVKGEHISYSTRTEVFQVSGSANDADDPVKGRVHATIQPKGKPGDAQNEGQLTIRPSSTLSTKKP